MKTFSLITGFLIAITASIAHAESSLANKDNPVLVTVNGVDITQAEVQHFIGKQNNVISVQKALQELINVELLSQAARNENMMRDETLQLELRRNKSALIASYYLQQQLNKLEISDEDLNARYKKEYLDSKQAKEYNANHILVETEQEAKDIIQQLDKDADFEELARSKSIGPSGKEGGALGWFKQGDMVAPFSQAAMLLEPGHYSVAPVKTQFGWHVIYLNDVRTPNPPTFESVRKSLSTAIAAESISEKLKELHDKAFIDVKMK